MAKSNRNSRSSVSKKDKMERALALRLRGLSYDKIGKEIGCTRQHAHRLVDEAIREVNEKIYEDSIKVKQMEILRLDGMFEKVFSIMEKSNKELNSLSAVDRMLKIMERRAKLLNLDEVISTGSEEVDEEYI